MRDLMRFTRRAAALALPLALAACADAVVAPNDARPALGRAGGAGAAAAVAAVTCTPGNGDITLPPGFCAAVVADNVGTARHIVVAGTGDIYVAIDQESNPNGILALRDTDGDGDADQSQYFGTPRANGIAIYRQWLYVAYRTEIVRYRLVPGELVPSAPREVVVSGLPGTPFLGENDHPRKNITFDGRSFMYVNHGSASNSCQVENRVAQSPGVDPCPELPTRAGIWRFNANVVGQTLANGVRFATGFRNTEALRYDPGRRALYGLPHGRDELHENWPQFFTEQDQADLPAEEFIRIDQGDDAGWPYCFYDGIRNVKVLAPEYGGNGRVVGPRCFGKERPLLDFPGHWAPNDLLFYYGTQFPARYRGGAFIAFHGGHDRAPLPNEGYNVVFVPFNANTPSQSWEIFADGFTGGGTPLPQNAAHRPMGLAEGPDGSLYVTDDDGGRIWRIVFVGP
jgi:glucose/arabinose dehydrogenase